MNTTVSVYYKGVEFEVEFDFQPEEKQTYDYPGCGASVDITGISCNGIDFSEFFFEYGDKKEIAKIVNEFERLVWDARANN